MYWAGSPEWRNSWTKGSADTGSRAAGRKQELQALWGSESSLREPASVFPIGLLIFPCHHGTKGCCVLGTLETLFPLILIMAL